jgi:hypothetical protein
MDLKNAVEQRPWAGKHEPSMVPFVQSPETDAASLMGRQGLRRGTENFLE